MPPSRLPRLLFLLAARPAFGWTKSVQGALVQLSGRAPPPPPSPPPLPPAEPPDSVLSQLRAGLSAQVQRSLEEQGSAITIMVVGETGVGKTSLLSNLFHRRLDWPSGARTPRVIEQTVAFTLGGGREAAAVPFTAHLIDSPGWGDLMSLTRSFRLVTRHIDRLFHRELRAETRLHRARASGGGGRHVDVVLYTFNAHRCKGVDIAFLKRLARRVTLVPILTKADTMTVNELATFRKEVSDALAAAGVRVAHPPFAVICADKDQGPGVTRGRTYLWGTARSEDEAHSELPKLRRFLLTDGLLALKQASVENYERYRRRVLLRARVCQALACLASVAAADARARAWVGRLAAEWMHAACARLPAVPSVRITWHRRQVATPAPQPAAKGWFLGAASPPAKKK